MANDSTRCNPFLALEVSLRYILCPVGALTVPLFDNSIYTSFTSNRTVLVTVRLLLRRHHGQSNFYKRKHLIREGLSQSSRELVYDHQAEEVR